MILTLPTGIKIPSGKIVITSYSIHYTKLYEVIPVVYYAAMRNRLEFIRTGE